MGSIARGEESCRRLTVEGCLIIELVMRVDAFLFAIPLENDLPAKSVDLHDVAADEILIGESILQVSLRIIKIPTSLSCPLGPPQDLLAIIYDMVRKQLLIIMGLALFADEGPDAPVSNIDAAEIKCITCPADPQKIGVPVSAREISENREFYDLVLEAVHIYAIQLSAVTIRKHHIIFYNSCIPWHRKLVCPCLWTWFSQRIDNCQFPNLGPILSDHQTFIAFSDPSADNAGTPIGLKFPTAVQRIRIPLSSIMREPYTICPPDTTRGHVLLP